MSLFWNWMPATRDNWTSLIYGFQFFPAITIGQWFDTDFPAGKTSIESKFNIPGRLGWMTMETPGMLNLLYIMYTVPGQLGIRDLPWQNKLLAGLYTVHYTYRSLIGPMLNPSMSPMHIQIWIFAVIFQYVNSTSIGGWLAGYGPSTAADWAGRPTWTTAVGLLIWAAGFATNVYHDDLLRDIRRQALKRKRADAAAKKALDPASSAAAARVSVDKVYEIPDRGLFRWILFPHYVAEWVEWTGFWIVAGAGCVPARMFVLNEICTMMPRAYQSRKWYVKKFGAEKVGNKAAIIPGLL